jgi:hypothetical protein
MDLEKTNSLAILNSPLFRIEAYKPPKLKKYTLRSPGGATFQLYGETIFHAVAQLIALERGKYSASDYLKINTGKP